MKRRTRVVHAQSEFDMFILQLCEKTLPPPVQPRPRWKDYCNEAIRRILAGVGWSESRDKARQIADEIVANKDGPAFLKSVRRGRGTKTENIRTALLREVERLVDLERRRPTANLPTLKLSPVESLELFRSGAEKILTDPAASGVFTVTASQWAAAVEKHGFPPPFPVARA